MITSRSFGLHASHTTKIVAYTGYASLRSASAAVKGAMPQMVPAVTRSANFSLAGAIADSQRVCIAGRNAQRRHGVRSA
jgi:hypothetical protein